MYLEGLYTVKKHNENHLIQKCKKKKVMAEKPSDTKIRYY